LESMPPGFREKLGSPPLPLFAATFASVIPSPVALAFASALKRRWTRE
jgi:hypothetical protein